MYLDLPSMDVFPDKLPSDVPPDRGVAHRIEVEPGSSPPCGPIYRMPQVELDELKGQLEELEEDGFIQPSVSPYGCPVGVCV